MLSYAYTVLFAVAAIAALAKYLSKTDIPKIIGLPELPGIPVFGSLFLLGKHHARNCATIARRHGWPVFQVRLGNRRVVYANTFDSVKDLWIGKQSALISRPRFWTFHDVVSETQGVFTIGTSPWSEATKRTRKAAATAMNKRAVQEYLPFIDLELTSTLRDMLKKVQNGDDLDPNGYFQKLSLNISLTLAFGLRISGSVKDETLWDVIQVERELGNIRGIAHCWQDYVPCLRLFPSYKKNAIAYRARRDKYILSFYEQLQERIAAGTDHPCIAGNVMKDPEARLDEQELKSISLTMVAAGLDTLPGNINMTLAYLSSDHGQEVQQRAYDEIIRSYPGEDPWDMCLLEEKSEFMRSFVKEVLRYWSTLNLSFSRQSTQPIEYNGATIPSGTPFFMNSWAANHDPDHFKAAIDFIPDRFVGVAEEGGGTQHFAYGAGSRLCTGIHLANRELYAIFTRIILAFHVRQTTDESMLPNLDTIECNAVPTSMVTQPKPFKVSLEPRNRTQLDRWIERSLEQTAHLT